MWKGSDNHCCLLARVGLCVPDSSVLHAVPHAYGTDCNLCQLSWGNEKCSRFCILLDNDQGYQKTWGHVLNLRSNSKGKKMHKEKTYNLRCPFVFHSREMKGRILGLCHSGLLQYFSFSTHLKKIRLGNYVRTTERN